MLHLYSDYTLKNKIGEGGQTYLVSPAYEYQKVITVNDPRGFNVEDYIYIGEDRYLIGLIFGNNLNLTTLLKRRYDIGTRVLNESTLLDLAIINGYIGGEDLKIYYVGNDDPSKRYEDVHITSVSQYPVTISYSLDGESFVEDLLLPDISPYGQSGDRVKIYRKIFVPPGTGNKKMFLSKHYIRGRGV